MKQTVVGVALIAGLAQLAAAPAQATPRVDPVKALQAAWTRGKGMNVVSTTKVDYGRGLFYTFYMDGTVGLGAQGEITSDESQSLQLSKRLMSGLKKLGMGEDAAEDELPLRVISSGHDDYVSGPSLADALPQGTSWVRYPYADRPTGNLLLDVLEPTTLKALLAHRTSWRGGVLKGTIKTDKLAKVSRSFASRFGAYSGSEPVSTVAYTLRLGSTGLVERLSAKGVLRSYKGSLRIDSDTRYSAWGQQVTVLLPLRGDVIDQEQLKGKVPNQVPSAWN
ncbi:hypothetical protein [Nonomuraea sp. NPDC049141]|uniref:hypothetical protein n=1 Tax=Nonomuraea sp. NPDC049141 TaxID=3155500 RepID=UPI0033E6FE9A